MPDAGAAGVSTARHQQVLVLQKIDSRVEIDTSTAGNHKSAFEKSKTSSLGTIKVNQRKFRKIKRRMRTRKIKTWILVES